MGAIDIIKPLCTVLSSGVNKSWQHQEKNYLKCQELNQGQLGEKQVCYLCAIQPQRLPPLPSPTFLYITLFFFFESHLSLFASIHFFLCVKTSEIFFCFCSSNFGFVTNFFCGGGIRTHNFDFVRD